MRVVAPDEREARQIEPDRARGRALADDDVERVVLHRRIEHLFHRAVEAVDLVDEEHVALVEVGEYRGKISRPLDGRPARRLSLTPSSLAMTCASVVLPSPGGPESRMWSSGSSRPRAASMSTPRFSLTRVCPRYSSRCLRPQAAVYLEIVLGQRSRDEPLRPRSSPPASPASQTALTRHLPACEAPA